MKEDHGSHTHSELCWTRTNEVKRGSTTSCSTYTSSTITYAHFTLQHYRRISASGQWIINQNTHTQVETTLNTSRTGLLGGAVSLTLKVYLVSLWKKERILKVCVWMAQTVHWHRMRQVRNSNVIGNTMHCATGFDHWIHICGPLLNWYFWPRPNQTVIQWASTSLQQPCSSHQ